MRHLKVITLLGINLYLYTRLYEWYRELKDRRAHYETQQQIWRAKMEALKQCLN